MEHKETAPTKKPVAPVKDKGTKPEGKSKWAKATVASVEKKKDERK